MRFNIIFFISGVILLLTSASFDVNFFNFKRSIPFEQWKTISFSDFTGLKKPGLTLGDVSRFAYIKTSREIVYLSNGDIRVTAYFHPARSYVFNEQMRNPDLLQHELYHFHITEYWTRRLRKDILSYKGKSLRNFIAKQDNIYYHLETEMQQRYDEETNHSYIMQKQTKWQTDLDEKLISLANFSSALLVLRK